MQGHIKQLTVLRTTVKKLHINISTVAIALKLVHNLFIKSPGITVKHLNSLYLGALWIAAKSDDNKLPAGCKKLRNIVDYYYHCYEKFYGDGKREGSIESQSDEVFLKRKIIIFRYEQDLLVAAEFGTYPCRAVSDDIHSTIMKTNLDVEWPHRILSEILEQLKEIDFRRNIAPRKYTEYRNYGDILAVLNSLSWCVLFECLFLPDYYSRICELLTEHTCCARVDSSGNVTGYIGDRSMKNSNTNSLVSYCIACACILTSIRGLLSYENGCEGTSTTSTILNARDDDAPLCKKTRYIESQAGVDRRTVFLDRWVPTNSDNHKETAACPSECNIDSISCNNGGSNGLNQTTHHVLRYVYEKFEREYILDMEMGTGRDTNVEAVANRGQSDCHELVLSRTIADISNWMNEQTKVINHIELVKSKGIP